MILAWKTHVTKEKMDETEMICTAKETVNEEKKKNNGRKYLQIYTGQRVKIQNKDSIQYQVNK